MQKIEQELLKNVNLTSLQKKITKVKSIAAVDVDQDSIDKLLDLRGSIITEYDKLSGD